MSRLAHPAFFHFTYTYTRIYTHPKKPKKTFGSLGSRIRKSFLFFPSSSSICTYIYLLYTPQPTFTQTPPGQAFGVTLFSCFFFLTTRRFSLLIEGAFLSTFYRFILSSLRVVCVCGVGCRAGGV